MHKRKAVNYRNRQKHAVFFISTDKKEIEKSPYWRKMEHRALGSAINGAESSETHTRNTESHFFETFRFLCQGNAAIS